jgi:enoyl-CoA hydratase/carnithine racemase
MTAEEAVNSGLLSRVVPRDQLMAHVDSIASMIAAHGTAAVRALLHAVRGGLDIPLSEGLVREAELFGHLCATPEKRQAVQAFLDKRQARMAQSGA